jgi:RNA polymerase sigma-70 factor (ECF subfamily)
MLPTGANGQPATVCYVRDEQGTYRPYGVAVFTMTRAGISKIFSFGDPGLVAAFGFPANPPGVRLNHTTGSPAAAIYPQAGGPFG